MQSYRLVRTCFLVFVLTLAIGCSENDPISPMEDPGSDIEALIESGGPFDDPMPSEVVMAGPDTTTQIINGENWVCISRTLNVTTAPDEFALFDPNSEILFAGNLLQGASLGDATPRPIPVRRGPGTVVITLLSGAASGVSQDVPEVTLSNVFDAQNLILSQSPDVGTGGIIPARFTFSMEEVQSKEQLALALDVNGDVFGVTFGASFSFSQDKEYNRFVVKLNQSFFTVAFQLPTSTADIFASGVTVSDVDPYIGNGNPAAFISSVTYGRIFYLLIESTARKETIAASLNASFSGVSGSASGSFIGDLENLVVKAFALGGEANSALQAITTDFETLKEFLALGGDIRTGVPVSYVVRSVRDPSKIVKVALNDEYDVVDCVPTLETLADAIFWFDADKVTTTTHVGLLNSRTERFQVWPDLSPNGNDATALFDPNDPNGFQNAEFHPVVIADIVNGVKPATVFDRRLALSTLGFFEPKKFLRIRGGEFIGSNYSIVVVAALRDDFASGFSAGVVNYPFDFISGICNESGKMLRIGFTGPNELSWDHGGASLGSVPGIVATVPHADRFNIYTMIFSTTNGMSLYVNGHLVKSEPTATVPLQEYLGAIVGHSVEPVDQGPFSPAFGELQVGIAEMMAYGNALTSEQRVALEDNLRRKYKL